MLDHHFSKDLTREHVVEIDIEAHSDASLKLRQQQIKREQHACSREIRIREKACGIHNLYEQLPVEQACRVLTGKIDTIMQILEGEGYSMRDQVLFETLRDAYPQAVTVPVISDALYGTQVHRTIISSAVSKLRKRGWSISNNRISGFALTSLEQEERSTPKDALVDPVVPLPKTNLNIDDLCQRDYCETDFIGLLGRGMSIAEICGDLAPSKRVLLLCNLLSYITCEKTSEPDTIRNTSKFVRMLLVAYPKMLKPEGMTFGIYGDAGTTKRNSGAIVKRGRIAGWRICILNKQGYALLDYRNLGVRQSPVQMKGEHYFLTEERSPHA